MDAINILIWAVAIFFVLRIVNSWAHSTLKEKIEEKEELIKKLNDVIHVVKEEKHNGITYWFDKDTDRFLAQGANLDEIRAHIKHRFTKHVFLINETEMLANSKETQQYEIMPIADLLK